MALLENIRVFVRVVELGSLSAAGRHMRLSPAVVSHRLQQLESHLGARLLNRTTRQVQPTEHGLVYYNACQDVLSDSSLIARKLADCPRVLCAAPAYLEATGRPAVPEDLLEHRCLLLRFAGSRQFRWTLTTPDGPLTLPVAGHLDADDGDVLTEWALLGQGIALKPLWEVAAHLRAGRLEAVLTEFPPEPVVLAVLYPHRRLLPAKVKAFADFMVERGAPALAAAGAPDAGQARAETESR